MAARKLLSASFVSLALFSACSSDPDPKPDPMMMMMEEEECEPWQATAQPASTVKDLLEPVTPGTTWQDLPDNVRAGLASDADATRRWYDGEWGADALAKKETFVVECPTAEMAANVDRLYGLLLASQLPEGMTLSQAVTSAELKKQLARLYLGLFAERRNLMFFSVSDPDGTTSGLRDWDASDLRPRYSIGTTNSVNATKALGKSVVEKLRALDASTLSDVEKKVLDKALFYARQVATGSAGLQHGSNSALNAGTALDVFWSFVSTPSFDGFVESEAQLLALANAYSFVALERLDTGSVESFGWLSEAVDFEAQNLTNPTLAKGMQLINAFWLHRVRATDVAACSPYTTEQRAETWDAFTAGQLADNANQTTMEQYAGHFGSYADRVVADLRADTLAALRFVFPDGSAMLAADQRQAVEAAIAAETRPAALPDTILAALDTVTGTTAASTHFAASLDDLTWIGGYDDPNVPVRAEDVAAIHAMWNEVKSYLARKYAGRLVDIAAHLPAAEELHITTSDSIYVDGSTGELSIGLAFPFNKASMYSVLLHEGKHVIDVRAKNLVEGAAWEGAALTVEDQVWPDFIEEVMADEASKLPIYRFLTAIQNFRLIATTDATLKVALRDGCPAGTPSSNDFAIEVVRGWGMPEQVLQLRSIRAHYGLQYLTYIYGQIAFLALQDYLQERLGAGAPEVDPFLLQACGMPTPAMDAESVAKLKTCLGIAP